MSDDVILQKDDQVHKVQYPNFANFGATFKLMKRYSKYLSFPLLTLLIASTFSTAFVQVAFNANKTQIIKELCQNRFQPEMQCNGKCYLKKQLKEQEENRGDKDSKLVNETINWLSLEINAYEHYVSEGIALTSVNVLNLHKGFLTAIDRPPPCLA